MPPKSPCSIRAQLAGIWRQAQRGGSGAGVRCSSSCSAPGGQGGPKPLLPASAVPGTPSPLLLHQECKTPRLVKKIRVELKPSWHMGLFKLATAWLSPSVGCNTAVMSLVPRLSMIKGLHERYCLNSPGARSPPVPLLSGCLAATGPRETGCVTAPLALADGPGHEPLSRQGHLYLSIKVLSSGWRYLVNQCTHQGMFVEGREGCPSSPKEAG